MGMLIRKCQKTEDFSVFNKMQKGAGSERRFDPRYWYFYYNSRPKIAIKFVAEDESEICGAIELIVLDGGHVFGMYVAPNHRRKGIASALLQESETYARRHGSTSIDLLVETNNEPAIKLYQKAGYEITGSHMDLLEMKKII